MIALASAHYTKIEEPKMRKLIEKNGCEFDGRWRKLWMNENENGYIKHPMG